MVPRIKLSATSDLKEFHGRDQDEDRARSWVSTVKTAFIRDQAPDDERCLVFGGLLTGPAQNWYRQLGRSVRGNWKDLMQEFMIRFCGTGVPVARQFHHARKRSEETPLDYLYRLNVLGLRAKMKIKVGSPKFQKDHVDHNILTVDDPEIGRQVDYVASGGRGRIGGSIDSMSADEGTTRQDVVWIKGSGTTRQAEEYESPLHTCSTSAPGRLEL